MARGDQLTPLTERTPAEAFAIRSAGGRASAKVKKERKEMREVLAEMLTLQIPDNKVSKEMALLGLTKMETNVQATILYKQIMKAIDFSDTRAAEFCRDTVGDKPTDKVEHSSTTTLIKDDLNE